MKVTIQISTTHLLQIKKCVYLKLRVILRNNSLKFALIYTKNWPKLTKLHKKKTPKDLKTIWANKSPEKCKHVSNRLAHTWKYFRTQAQNIIWRYLRLLFGEPDWAHDLPSARPWPASTASTCRKPSCLWWTYYCSTRANPAIDMQNIKKKDKLHKPQRLSHTTWKWVELLSLKSFSSDSYSTAALLLSKSWIWKINMNTKIYANFDLKIHGKYQRCRIIVCGRPHRW